MNIIQIPEPYPSTPFIKSMANHLFYQKRENSEWMRNNNKGDNLRRPTDAVLVPAHGPAGTIKRTFKHFHLLKNSRHHAIQMRIYHYYDYTPLYPSLQCAPCV